MSSSSFFTLTFVPLVMMLLFLVERRFGSARAGWVSGFPVVGAPALVILVIEHGEKFGASAAMNGLKGIVGWAAFILTFRLAPSLVRSSGTIGICSVSVVVWSLAAATTTSVRVPSQALAGFVGFAVVIAVLAGSIAPATVRPGLALLVARVVLAPVFVLLVVIASEVLGAEAAGVLTTFPIVSSTLLYSGLVGVGVEHARALSSGMLVAGPGLATFMLLAHELLQTSVAAALGLTAALAGALVVHCAMWRVMAWRLSSRKGSSLGRPLNSAVR